MRLVGIEKNIVLLGAATIFVLVAWIYFEITKSEVQIAQYSEPSTSLLRGEAEAEEDFRKGRWEFKMARNEREKLTFLGVEDSIIKEQFDVEPSAFAYLWCVVVTEGYESWNVPEDYKHNQFYVVGYNRRLFELLTK